MAEQKRALNFATDDFSDKDFLDFIKEPIQEKIQYFSVLMSKKDNEEEPLIFWLNTGRKKWYRFFMDAWITHWHEYDEREKETLMAEDFEEYDGSFVRNLAKELDLIDKELKAIEVHRFYENEQYVAQIKISIEENLTIIVRDYNDEKSASLMIDYSR